MLAERQFELWAPGLRWVADFTTGVANHIAVVSNDSDFVTLFKIQELACGAGNAVQPPPTA